ncbi:MAG: Mov34/MPN/PAD-1 family protein [Candidatus Verstraetearchaeota archaeon]|nr:Mov34/MPN/PAD-1 family protein [Candidatus Verstraetearchaeota archaeon]
MLKEVVVSGEVLEVFLELCREVFPRENIMLIRGKVRGERAEIKEFLIPPFSTYGEGFSSFPTHMIPFDLSIIGIAHSHPSGSNNPSDEDLNHFYGRVMLIAAYPYGMGSVAAYNSKGIKIELTVD